MGKPVDARPPSIRRLQAKETSLRSRTTTKDEDYGGWKCKFTLRISPSPQSSPLGGEARLPSGTGITVDIYK